MKTHSFGRFLIRLYVVIFLFYMLAPLVVMGGAALNDSRFPSVYPWVGFTGRWFVDLWSDTRMWVAIRNTVLVAVAVVAFSVPIGTAAAILINGLQSRARSFLYGVMVAPILTPGAVIGISTLLFWNHASVPAGLHLSVLGQVSFIAAYVMLLVLARLQSFDQGLEHAPGDAELWHDKGTTYAKIRLFAEAVDAFDRAIAADVEHAGAWSDRGKALGALGRQDEARESLDRAVLLAPHHPAPWQNKALLEESLGREADALASYREFLARAEPAMTLQIEHAKARTAVLEARVRAVGGEVPAAPIPPAVAPSGTPSAPLAACLQRGEANLTQGQWEKALSWFQQALMHDASAHRAWAGAGEALMELQKWPESASHLAKAVELIPAYVLGWQRYAQALDTVDRPAEALAAWDKAVELAPGNLLLWNGRGVTYLRQGRLDDALANFERALAIDPRYALAKFNKAAVEEKLGRPADAATSLKQFLALATPNLATQIQQARWKLEQLSRT